jgi:hypothetical protein
LDGAVADGARGAAAGVAMYVCMLVTELRAILSECYRAYHSAVKCARTVRNGKSDPGYNESTRSG